MPSPNIHRPCNLKTEWLENPIGIGESLPVLSWKLMATQQDVSATAWQILVADSEDVLSKEKGNCWDSGKVFDPRVNQAVYAGRPVASRRRYWWKIRVWDREDRPSEWSQAAFWEMGLLDVAEWRASWIASSVVGDAHNSPPSPYFRKSFQLPQGLVSARLYTTALGLYECEINGQRVGDHVLSPGWTDYPKRLHYQTYDVTELLRAGENALGAILGDGWYCGRIATLDRQIYGERPQFLAQLEIVFEDGSTVEIVSDGSWKTRAGPILEGDLINGEVYDAREELPGWSSPDCDESGWQPAQILPALSIALVPQIAPPVRRIEELRPVAPARALEGARMFDLGQNFCGRVRISVKAARGVTLTIRHGEMLNPDGTLYTENLRMARATDTYTCGGSGEEIWEPRFTFHGFRHVEVRGLEPEHAVEVTGVVLHSDTPPAGSFSCSHPLLNQLQHNIVWAQKSCFLELPMDCPQRDERLGWADALTIVRTSAFNADVRGFFRKWIQDLRDAQKDTGSIPPTIPSARSKTPDSGPAWSDVVVICPWIIYLCYADKKILEEHYDSMRRFMDYLAAHRCKDNIRSHPDVDPWGGFGDWLALDMGAGCGERGVTPCDLIGTAFYAYDAQIMSRVAAVLGRQDDAAHFEALRSDTVKAFQRRFVTRDGLLASGTQTSYVLALHFGLLPEELRTAASKELARKIEMKRFHLDTGSVGTPYLCQALEDSGYLDVAYKLLEQETFPSWLFPVKNGATTIWERWDGWTPEKGFQTPSMNSFNHADYGTIGAWMYRTVAGLELDPNDPGYRHVIFRPRPGGSITWAVATLETPLGKTAIKWELKDETLHLALTVPVNARASLRPPEGFSSDAVEFGSGTHQVVLTRYT